MPRDEFLLTHYVQEVKEESGSDDGSGSGKGDSRRALDTDEASLEPALARRITSPPPSVSILEPTNGLSLQPDPGATSRYGLLKAFLDPSGEDFDRDMPSGSPMATSSANRVSSPGSTESSGSGSPMMSAVGSLFQRGSGAHRPIVSGSFEKVSSSPVGTFVKRSGQPVSLDGGAGSLSLEKNGAAAKGKSPKGRTFPAGGDLDSDARSSGGALSPSVHRQSPLVMDPHGRYLRDDDLPAPSLSPLALPKRRNAENSAAKISLAGRMPSQYVRVIASDHCMTSDCK